MLSIGAKINDIGVSETGFSVLLLAISSETLRFMCIFVGVL